MIDVKDKRLCCGCGACAQRCPRKCIDLVADGEGFLYPKVDIASCTQCGLCEQVCHELHPYEERTPLKVIAAVNTDTEVRRKSSSGGIFSILAEKTISEGGVVFGARFDHDWQVTLDYTEKIEGLELFRGSKYVQARTEDTYKQAELFLKSGRKVLYTGTPCQIAGLHHFLRKDYGNLMTVDLICHGTPSPKVWERYLDEISHADRTVIGDIQFRDKGNGWKLFNMKIEFNDGRILSSYHRTNPYMLAFLNDMILRPSCHSCKAKHGASQSDITIADFWGINHVLPQMDDDKGTSLVFINTDKGNQYISSLDMKVADADIDVAARYNAGISTIAVHPNRKQFFDNLDSFTSVIKLVNIELPVLKGYHPKTIIKRLIKSYRLFCG